MKSYTSFLYDADGTLIDTTELIFRCFLYSCQRYGGFTIDRERVVRNIGLPLYRQFELYLGILTEDQFIEIAGSHMDYQMSIYHEHLRLFPGIAEGLAAQKQSGIKLAVVTSRRIKSLSLFLDKLGILHYFDALVTPETTLKHKPEPEPALKALEMLGSAPGEAILVGDSQWDIECGHAAGMDTALVSWAECDPATMPVKPTFLLKSISPLVLE